MRQLGNNDLVASYWTIAGAGFGEGARWSFAERVAAAAQAGFAGIGLRDDDIARCHDLGLSDAEMRSIAEAHGIQIAELEILHGWSSEDPHEREESRKVEDVLLAAASTFGTHHINVATEVPDRAPPIERIAERFAALCERAAPSGALIALEFMPWTSVPDASTASRVIELADRPNGGILIDAWHHFRGSNDFAQLRQLRREHIVTLQLDDADAEVVGTLREDTRLRRKAPGLGALDLVTFLTILEEKGIDAPYSVEIMSAEQSALDLNAAARLAHDSTRSVLTKAR